MEYYLRIDRKYTSWKKIARKCTSWKRQPGNIQVGRALARKCTSSNSSGLNHFVFSNQGHEHAVRARSGSAVRRPDLPAVGARRRVGGVPALSGGGIVLGRTLPQDLQHAHGTRRPARFMIWCCLHGARDWTSGPTERVVRGSWRTFCLGYRPRYCAAPGCTEKLRTAWFR